MIIIREKLLEIWRLGKSFREISTRRRWVLPIEGVAEGGSFPVICSWEKFPHLSQERPKNRVDISPRTLPREEIVVGFSRICADGGNHSQKLFPRKCFTDPPRNWNRKFPQNFSQARISDWIFPGHCRWEKN